MIAPRLLAGCGCACALGTHRLEQGHGALRRSAVVAMHGAGQLLVLDGELLRLNQLVPDPVVLAEQQARQADLFGDSES